MQQLIYWNWIALQSGNENPQKTNVDSVKVGDKSAVNGQARLDKWKEMLLVFC